MTTDQNSAPRLTRPDPLPPEVLAEVEAAWRALKPGGYALVRLERPRGRPPRARVVVDLEERPR